jgi:hypothetical protein
MCADFLSTRVKIISTYIDQYNIFLRSPLATLNFTHPSTMDIRSCIQDFYACITQTLRTMLSYPSTADALSPDYIRTAAAIALVILVSSYILYTVFKSSPPAEKGVDSAAHTPWEESEYPPGMRIDEVFKRKKWHTHKP